MEHSCTSCRWRLGTGFLAIALLTTSCRPVADEAPQSPTATAEQASPATADTQLAEKPAAPPALQPPAKAAQTVGEPAGTRRAEADRVRQQLYEPLVEQPDRLKQLDPKAPIWIDSEKTKVVLVGAVCQRQTPLELFACAVGTKEYESVVAVPVPASTLHAALMATGVEPGHPAQFGEKYVPPAGPVIDITLHWKDEQGKKQTGRAQDWIRKMGTQEPMSHPWVFVGSRLAEQETGKPFYLADASGNLICVSNFPDSVLDVPAESTDSDASLLFEAFTERIPSRGTPVTLVLTPKKAPAEAAQPK